MILGLCRRCRRGGRLSESMLCNGCSLPKARALGRRDRVLLPLAVIVAVAIELALAGCCPKPKPPAAPVVVTEKRCLDGVTAPEVVAIPSVRCGKGAGHWCIDRVEYSRLTAHLKALYRYVRRAEERCRPRSQAREPEET